MLEAMAVQQVHTELELLGQITIFNQVLEMAQVHHSVVQLAVVAEKVVLVEMHLVVAVVAVLVWLIAFLVHH
jgi:hypothetical protein